MRLINGFSVNEKEFAFIKRRLTQFLANENECTSRCPMFRKDYTEHPFGRMMDPAIQKLEERLECISGMCICNLFEELTKSDDSICPCASYGEDAFRRLAIVVKQLEDPDAFLDRR
jgi:hypothetical protein